MQMSCSKYLQTLQKLTERRAFVTKLKLKLERPREISRLLNNPYNNFKCIHVAGTNGILNFEFSLNFCVIFEF